jgi:Skp family chaperone for outer membrane proteins
MATKQLGGWYWQPEQNKALRWWGTDSAGKDIYTAGDEPSKPQTVSNLSTGLSTVGSGNVLGFDLNTLNSKFQDTYGQIQGLSTDLEDYSTRRYDEEYSKAGLGKTKDEIAALDASIASEKNVRDESVSKVRKNPGYSAATITGETGEVQKIADSKIGNLIEERNAKAQTYNATLGEITQRVATETQGKQSKLTNLRSDLQLISGLVDSYNKTRSTELSSQTDETHWEKEFELKLYSAQTDRMKTGDGGGTYAKQQVKDAFGNVTGFFDPVSGQTTPYQTDSQKNQTTTVNEGELRNEIRAAWKTGLNADQLKTNLANVTTDKGKNASQVIDEEWQLKNQPGITGFLRRLFTPGV